MLLPSLGPLTPRARASQPRVQAEASCLQQAPGPPRPRHRKPTRPASISAGRPPTVRSAPPAQRPPSSRPAELLGGRSQGAGCPGGTVALSGGHKRCGAVSSGVRLTQRWPTAGWAPSVSNPHTHSRGETLPGGQGMGSASDGGR